MSLSGTHEPHWHRGASIGPPDLHMKTAGQAGDSWKGLERLKKNVLVFCLIVKTVLTVGHVGHGEQRERKSHPSSASCFYASIL